MAIGFKRHGNEEYAFIDGKAMRQDEAVRIDLGNTAAPGQEEALGDKTAFRGRRLSSREALAALDAEDAFTLSSDAKAGLDRSSQLIADDRRKLRRRYAAFGAVLVAAAFLSLCISNDSYFTLYSPADVLASLWANLQLGIASVNDPAGYPSLRAGYLQTVPMYQDVFSQLVNVAKYLIAGVLLALSGMLYQCTFRNPIAAPSMLGVSNGVSFGLLVLVMQFGTSAVAQTGRYYLYSFIGGAAVLALVLLGGKMISGRGRFSVVNLILIGTVVSQFLGAIITYVQTMLMSGDVWETYYLVQTAAGLDTGLVMGTLGIGLLVSFIPVFVFRFRLNLISFSDDETRLLGVDPNKLRILALGCGSLMILVAQINVGQVAMASLVVPFVTRYVFGSEFRKQLGGNVLVGALVLLLCGDVTNYVSIWGIGLDVGTVVTVCVMPLFVWMLAIRQRSWGE